MSKTAEQVKEDLKTKGIDIADVLQSHDPRNWMLAQEAKKNGRVTIRVAIISWMDGASHYLWATPVILGPGHWTDAGLSTPHDRIRARFQRATMLRVALAPYGLTAHDDGVTDGITLSTLSGAHVIVGNLDDLWHHAAILAGRPIDPLA